MAPVLGYWDIRGLATPIRLLLTHAGIEFEEKLYNCGPPFKSDHWMFPLTFDRSKWFNERSSLGLDFPNLPYFIDGDVKLTQSKVILGYIARKYGFDGKTEADKQRVELLTDQVVDYHMGLGIIAYSSEFEQLKVDYEKALPEKLKFVSKFLGDRQFIAGDYITYVDFVLFEYLEILILLDKNVLKNFPVLEKYHKTISNLDSVVKYFNSPIAIKFPFFASAAFFGGAFSHRIKTSKP